MNECLFEKNLFERFPTDIQKHICKIVSYFIKDKICIYIEGGIRDNYINSIIDKTKSFCSGYRISNIELKQLSRTKELYLELIKSED